MNTDIKTNFFKYNSLLAVLFVSLAHDAHAAPGALSSEPLFLSSTAKPNIMFLVDNSGSMSNVVPDSPYNDATDYTPVGCGTTITQVGAGTSMQLRIVGGVPKQRVGGTNRDFADRCYDRTTSYSAKLNADTGNSTNRSPSNYLSAKYSGNYLNWYFSTTDISGVTWTNQDTKPLTATTSVNPRMQIAQDAATGLITSLSNVRVGLASYNGGSGGTINVGIKQLDSSQRTSLNTAINGLSPSGSTPLAESLHEIGRYFVGESGSTNPGSKSTSDDNPNGQFDGSLTLHPSGTSSTKDDDTLFNRSLNYSAGVSSESPIQYWCQKNFAMLLTDGRPQSDRDISSTTGLQDYDGDCDGASPACSSYDRKNTGTYEYESAGSDYLDDVAQALYEIDLRPDIDDADGDEVTNNIITYTIGFADDQVINDPLMQDTADNGGGLFKKADNASELQTSLQNTLADIIAQVGSFASVSFNTSTLTTDSDLYLARFNSTRWEGELYSIPLNSDGSLPTDGSGNVDLTAANWNAATALDAMAAASRLMLTYNADTPAGVEFATLADLSTAMQNDLNMGPSGSADALGQERIDYLRGDVSDLVNPGNGFRARDSRLGHMVNSSPVFVGAPDLSWPDTAPFGAASARYSDFQATIAALNSSSGRTEIVYVGSNDGQLHGFRADTGVEVLAYVPNFLATTSTNEGLHYLTNPDFNDSPRFYVDNTPDIADAYIKTTSAGTVEWNTILVGTMRGGGRGLFALDITDPADFSIANADDIVMWELSSADDPDIGFTFSRPIIALTNADVSGAKRWAAIFGNGYNSGRDGGTGDCRAKLFIVFLDGGVDGSWSTTGSYDTTDYIEIDTESGSTASGDCNGLSSPSVLDLNGDGTADRVYAGDLKGNMWAFDICNETSGSCVSSGWKVAYTQGTTPKPLFTGATNQQITSKPVVITHPTASGSDPNLMVFFGTGQYLVDGDKSTTDSQSLYGIWDHGVKELTRGDLTSQLANDSSINTDPTLRVPTDNFVDYSASGVDGWYMDLPDSGERVVISPLIRGEIVFFNTIIPDPVPCGLGGSSWLMALKVENGGRPDFAAFDADGDGDVDIYDTVQDADDVRYALGGKKRGGGLVGGSAILDKSKYDTDSSGNVTRTTVGRSARLSWRELRND